MARERKMWAQCMHQFVLVFALCSIVSMENIVRGSDPDPVQDFAPGVTDFVFRDIFTHGQVTMDSGGIRAAVTPENFPAISTQGITYVRFLMVPCGCNLPHSHPRASEILTLISGGPLQVGFVDTDGTSHINILYPGDVTLFPRGMLHFELNVGTENAEYISALNGQNPGTLTAAAALFKLPQRALSAAFNQPGSMLNAINSTLSDSVAPTLKRVSQSGCVPGQNITIYF